MTPEADIGSLTAISAHDMLHGMHLMKGPVNISHGIDCRGD